jgi:hypothetical protein
MICTGTNTEANIRRALAHAAKVISKYAIEMRPPDVKPKKEKEEPKEDI